MSAQAYEQPEAKIVQFPVGDLTPSGDDFELPVDPAWNTTWLKG